MKKIIVNGDEARQKILAGVAKLADTVSATLGPMGRNCVIHYGFGGVPFSTKDGVTVAKEIDLPDPLEDAGAQMVKDVAAKTAENAGDGTTTATLLAYEIYKTGLALIHEGVNPVEIKREIESIVDEVCGPIGEHGKRSGGLLGKLSRPVHGSMIEQVGCISANNDPVIGKLIAEAIRCAGSDGVIAVEEGTTIETNLERSDGTEFNEGWISPYFVTDLARQETVLDNPYILVCDYRLGAGRTMLPLLQLVMNAGRPLLVVAENIEGEALPLLVVNHMQQKIKSCAVKAPGIGEHRKALLEDIAVLTGATALSGDLGGKAENIALTDLGSARKVIVRKASTTILDGMGGESAIRQRAEDIRTQISLTPHEIEIERDKLQERLARLSSGVVTIKVGAASRLELGYTKARIEDALHATRCALDEGIVPGGGVAYFRCAQLQNNHIANVVAACLYEPLRKIAENAGANADEIMGQLAHTADSFGWNALTNKFGDMIEMGVIDPTKVARLAFQNAASVAALMLTTESIIAIDKEETPPNGNQRRVP